MVKKDYSSWNKQEIIKELEIKDKKLKKTYGLIWGAEEEPERVVELCKEKLPVLVENIKKEIKKDHEEPTNILIEGDNYHTLSVLNYTHKGKIDFIYIDPPYNTKNQGFTYNDRLVDINDSYRHSKYLSHINKRLNLAKKILKKRGMITISIGEDEFAQLKLLCDEIFKEKNYVGCIARLTKRGGNKKPFCGQKLLISEWKKQIPATESK